MAWNLRPLSGTRPATDPLPEAASPAPSGIPPGAHDQLLVIFRRLAALLQLTSDIARIAGKVEPHAAMSARLAIFQARVEAGETSRELAAALAQFGGDFKTFVTMELGIRRN